jgi:proline utilization trans-activator
MASASFRKSFSFNYIELPSLGYTKYLLETTIFHLGDLYHVLDKARFVAQLEEFYTMKNQLQSLQGLWTAQLLLVIALGKMFLVRGASTLGPPGATEAMKALELISDVLDLWEDPVLRIESLCLASLYILTADLRSTAYTMVRGTA